MTRREIPIFLDGPSALSVWALEPKDGRAPEVITVVYAERFTRALRFEPDDRPAMIPPAIYGDKADYKRVRMGRLPFDYVPYVMTESQITAAHFDVAMRMVEALIAEQMQQAATAMKLVNTRLRDLEEKVHAIENNPLIEWAKTTIPQEDKK
jgi:hypothetical protein